MEIIITTHAQRQLKKFPMQLRLDLGSIISSLAAWPEVENVKKLKNRPDYRLRFGRYRILFEISEDKLYVTQVLLRDDKIYS